MKNIKWSRRPRVAFLIIVITLIVSLVSCMSPYSKTEALLEAIEAEDVAQVQLLLLNGIDPNQTNIPPSSAWSLIEISARRPLAVACRTGNLEIVELLIAHGATAENIEHTGWSPLRATLLRYDPNDIEIIRLLLANGADPDAIESGSNAIFAAADMSPYRLEEEPLRRIYEEDTAVSITRIVQMLLTDRAPSIQTESGATLLMYAAQSGNLHLAEYLMTQGCDISTTDHQGRTALDYAIAANEQDMIILLNEGNQ